MKAENFYSDLWRIKWNSNNIKDAKKAERKKAQFENKGFSFRSTTVNSITGECVSTYEAPLRWF